MQPAEPGLDDSPSRLGVWSVLLLILLVYAPSLWNGYSMDDGAIVDSTGVSSPGPDRVITAEFDSGPFDYLGKFFTQHYWYAESRNDGLYRPITVLSYGLVYQLAGRHLPTAYEPAPQHLVNVLLHVLAVWLVMQLMITLGARPLVTLLTGLLFGVHAIHSEVVAGVVGRAEILSFCFGVAALLLMLRGGAVRLVGAAALMFCAFGSKESSFCFIPFYFCLRIALRLAKREEGPWPQVFRDGKALSAVVAMLVPAVLWYLLRSRAMESEPIIEMAADYSSNPLAHTTDLVRVLTAVKIWGFALLLCFVPYELSCIYGPEVFAYVSSPADPWFLCSAIALLSLLTLGLRFARRSPILFLAMSCFLGFSFITSNVPMSIGTVFGERLHYTSSLGICLLPAALWPKLSGRGRNILLIVASLWCAGNISMTVHRCTLWHDSATLYFHDSKSHPRSIDLHHKSALCLQHGTPEMVEQAIGHLELALHIKPNYAHAHRLLADIHQRRGDYDSAIDSLRKSFGQGYPDPEGVEGMAFNQIGDCWMTKSTKAEDPASARRDVERAIMWFQKTTAIAEPWGRVDAQAESKIGHALVVLSKLSADGADRERHLIAALTAFAKRIDRGGRNQPAHFDALRQVFTLGVGPRGPRLPKARLLEIYRGAEPVCAGRFDLCLLMGEMAYRAGFEMELVFKPLDYAIRNYPKDPAKRGGLFYRAHLYVAEALQSMGRGDESQSIYRMLLQRPEIDEQLKAQIRTKLR